MSRSWDDVQSVLDDPFVSADTKEALLSAYVQENTDPWNGSNELPDEIYDYVDGTKAEYNISGSDAAPAQWGVSTDELYQAAQNESEETGRNARQTQDQIDANTSSLDGLQAPTSSTSGVEKSDELFDLGRPGMRVFDEFVPINNEVPGDTLGFYQQIDLDEMHTRYDEQMGISFKKFLEDAERLRAAHDALSGLDTTTTTELNTLYQSWTGPAANASYQYYSEQIVPNSSELIDFLSATPDMIVTLVENVFAECKAKADTVMSLYSPTVGSATPDMARKVVSLANGDIGDDDHDRILEVAAWVDSVCGSNLEDTIRSDRCDLNSENKEYVIRECKSWIWNSFNPDLHDNLYRQFDEQCTETLEAVNSYYEELNSYLAEYENKFSDAPPPPQQPPPQQPPPDQSGTPDSPGTPGSPSSPGSPGTPSMPSMPPPPSVPEMPGPEDTPMPEVPTPGADDPNNLVPTTPTTPGQQETVTIDDGDRSISVSSPDGQGQVSVTVDDGSGQPKTYTLDFGEGDETPGTPGTPGTPSTPGGPGASGQSGAGLGPEGPAGNRPPALDAPIQPGPDGKCVIEDGDLTITAERPDGSTDTVVVTVDDGTGEPVTYNLDYSGEDGPSATPRPLPAVGGDGPGGLPDPRGQFATGTPLPAPSAEYAPGGLPDPAGQYASTPTDPAGLPDPRGQFATGTPLSAPSAEYDPAGPPDPRGQFAATPGGLPDPAGQYGATTAQAATPGDGGGSFFSDPNGNAGQAGSFGVPDSSHYTGTPTDAPGEAGLATASDDGGGQQQHSQESQGQGVAPGGMPMMGGAAGAGASGGEQERAGSQWRTTGDLFDDVTDAQVRGAFGEGSR